MQTLEIRGEKLRTSFEIGHVVRLKCGSQAMVVEGFEYEDKIVEVNGDHAASATQLVCLCAYQHPNGDFVTIKLDADILKLERM